MKNILKTTPQTDLDIRRKGFDILLDKEDIENKVILDIGCGFGALVLYCLENKAKNVHGIEISAKDIETAKNYIQDKNAHFQEGSALKLPFPDNYFDTVVSFEVIEHIPKNSENKMFAEINRVMKKDGVLYLSTPFDSFLSKYFDPAYYLIGHRHYSKDQIINFATKNNLLIQKLKTVGTIYEFLNLMSLYFCKWVLNQENLLDKHVRSKILKDLKDEKKIGFMNLFLKARKF